MFKFPIVSQGEEMVVRCDIGEERELSTTEQPILALTGLLPGPGQQPHSGRDIGFETRAVVSGGFVALTFIYAA